MQEQGSYRIFRYFQRYSCMPPVLLDYAVLPYSALHCQKRAVQVPSQFLYCLHFYKFNRIGRYLYGNKWVNISTVGLVYIMAASWAVALVKTSPLVKKALCIKHLCSISTISKPTKWNLQCVLLQNDHEHGDLQGWLCGRNPQPIFWKPIGNTSAHGWRTSHRHDTHKHYQFSPFYP